VLRLGRYIPFVPVMIRAVHFGGPVLHRRPVPVSHDAERRLLSRRIIMAILVAGGFIPRHAAAVPRSSGRTWKVRWA